MEATSKTAKIDTGLLQERPIRITIPAKAAFNINQLQRVMVNLAERLGHPECMSGRNCLFEMETDFMVNPVDLSVHVRG